ADSNLLPHYMRIRSEVLTPKRGREHHHVRCTRLVISVEESTAQRRRDAQRVEHASRCFHRNCCLTSLRGSHHCEVNGVCSDRLELPRLLPEVQVIEPGGRVYHVAQRGGASGNRDDTASVTIRKRPQQHAVNHSEHGRVRADAQGQREHRQCGKPRILDHLAQSKTDVFDQETSPCSLDGTPRAIPSA